MLWKQIGNHLSALTTRPKFPQRLSQVSIGPLEGNELFVARQRFSVESDQLRLVIERVDLAERTGAKNDNHVGRFGREVGRPRCVRIGGVNLGRLPCRSLAADFVGEHRGERDRREAARCAREKPAAVELASRRGVVSDADQFIGCR